MLRGGGGVVNVVWLAWWCCSKRCLLLPSAWPDAYLCTCSRWPPESIFASISVPSISFSIARSISREDCAGWAGVVRCGGRASGPQLWWTVSQLRAKTIFRKLKSKLAAATLILLYLETNKIGAYSIETILLLYICYYRARPILGNIFIFIVVRGRL